MRCVGGSLLTFAGCHWLVVITKPMKHWLHCLRLLVAVTALFSIGSVALAQTTGSIRGVVVDEDELPIPGVLVTVSSELMIGGSQQVPSDYDGVFQFSEMMPGNYEILAQKAGFQTVSMIGVLVQINRTSTPTVTMPLGEEAEVYDVVAKRPAVDVESTSVGQVITKEYLQSIPVGRSYQQAVTLVTGVQRGYDGNPEMGGGANNENTILLDGATISDPVGGTFAANFNYDAVQQVEVLLGGYEPEYGISLGGVINLVTESGSNNLEFDTSVYYKNGAWRGHLDPRLTADGYELATTTFDTENQQIQVAAKISGPVIRDKAWFIFSYQLVKSLIRVAGVEQTRDFEGHYVLAKLTVQPNPDHRITAFIQADPTTTDNNDQTGIGDLTNEAQQRQVDTGFVAQGRWQWFPTREVNLDTSITVQQSGIELGSVPCTHGARDDIHRCRPDEREGNIDWNTPARLGVEGAFSTDNRPEFVFDDRVRVQVSSKLSLRKIRDPLGGTHDFKFGIGGEQSIWTQLVGVVGGVAFVDAPEGGNVAEGVRNSFWVEYSQPKRFKTTGGKFFLFAQDAYKPVENVTFKYGLRFDHSVMHNDLGEPIVSGSMVSPRIYAAWDPFGKKKTKIAGGYGRFNDTSRLEVAAFTSNSLQGSKIFLGEQWYGLGGGAGYFNNQNLMFDYTGKDERPTADPNLKLPRSDEFVMLLQQELIEDVALGANGTIKFTRHIYEFDETNLIYDEDGSAVIGSRLNDSFTQMFRLRTPKNARRNYYQADFYVEKVHSNRWAARLNYSYIAAYGTSDRSLSGSFANDPQTQYNSGPLNTNVNHQVKAIGYWQLPTDPWTLTLGGFFQYTGRYPIERLYYADVDVNGDRNYRGQELRIRDRGYYTYRPDWWELNLKLDQKIPVRRGDLAVSLEFLNLFNNQAARALHRDLYTTNRQFILTRQPGFQVQFGVRYDY